MLSLESLEDATQSFADDIINPRTANRRYTSGEDEEVSHWHSTPLAFAILPAVAGLLFQNGSTFVTDALLLALAAVFLNWSVRLPWDWYYSAQATKRAVEPEDISTIHEALDEDDAVETDAPSETQSPTEVEDTSERQQAMTDLRRQELLALIATFTFPILAAYLLHVIRAQLSRPSTGLVSDYNLTIFVLASEIRPCRQVCRLIAARTLHLQRLVTGLDDPTSNPTKTAPVSPALLARIEHLESELSTHEPINPSPTAPLAQKTDLSDLSSELKKRYEPRFEGLERAVRRYEKRSTTFTLLTEQRLHALENRTNDALSLAAVAAQNSQARSGVAAELVRACLLPLQVAWSLATLPVVAVEQLYARLKTLLLGPLPESVARGKKAGGVARFGAPDEKARLRGATARKPLR